MRNNTLLTALSLAFSVLVAVAPPAVAGAPTDQLRQQVDQVIRVLEDSALEGKPEARRAKVRKIVAEIFDYGDTARRALGTHWNARTPAERQEFTRLFADLLDRAYVSKIDLYQGEKVSYGAERINGDEATVKTKLVAQSGTSIPVDYRLHRKDGRWRVYDVNIEGVSLVGNYRTQFNEIVQTESYQSLVDKLKAKQAEPAASRRRADPRG